MKSKKKKNQKENNNNSAKERKVIFANIFSGFYKYFRQALTSYNFINLFSQTFCGIKKNRHFRSEKKKGKFKHCI